MTRWVAWGSAAAFILLAGCGGSSSAIMRGVAREADDVGRLVTSKHVPRQAPRVNPAAVPEQQVTAAAADLARPVDEIPSEGDAWQLIRGACEAADIIEAGQSWDSALAYLKGKSPGLQYPNAAEELLENLVQADTSGDVIRVLGKAALCEAADRKA